jgi:tryptophan synthase alpha chain
MNSITTPSITDYIQGQRQHKPILAMTHVIYGYPTIEESLAWMTRLLEEGVEFLEVQFPFSDPIADGPSIAAACHNALENNPKVETCLSHLGLLARGYPQSRIVLMSYLNPMYRYGLNKLAQRAAEEGIVGLILPDLPIEQAQTYRSACAKNNIEPIWLVTPSTPEPRLQEITSQANSFLYCVARTGVTGNSSYNNSEQKSSLEQESGLIQYITHIKAHTNIPLGIGFGLRKRKQVEQLEGKVDVAILGSALLDAYIQGGQESGITLYRELFPY